MSYISAVKIGEHIVVWEKDEKGKRIKKSYDAPYNFYIESNKGEYTSLSGKQLALFEFDNGTDFWNAKKKCAEHGITMYESDVPPELKILSEVYYGEPAPKLNVTFYDIENDYDSKIGYSGPGNPYAVVNAIAMFHEHKNKMVVIAIPPSNAECEIPELGLAGPDYIQKMNDITPIIEGCEIEILFVATEKELLLKFLEEIEDTDVIAGWNNSGFDDPYMGKRIEEVLGHRCFKKLSFDGAPTPKWRDIEIYGKEQPVIDLYGRISLDYLTLFKKYMVENQASYKLDNIADKFLRTDGKPDMPKLEYEGSLADLYRQNFDYFIRYNIRDTEILHGFETKLKYVALANEMVHISTGQFTHVAGTTKLAELAVMNFCHHVLDNLIIGDKQDLDWGDDKIKGAIVLDPVMGIHEWVSSVDLNSLYPSVIRANNISPETKIGQFLRDEGAFEDIRDKKNTNLTFVYEHSGVTETHTAAEWRELLLQKNHCVSGFGTVFTLEKKGVIPLILEDWYTSRKVYQKAMNEAKQAAGQLLKDTDGSGRTKRGGVAVTATEAAEYDELMEIAGYNDRLQYVYKIKLNSFYGALANQHFKFGDRHLGESTTAGGRHIVTHQHRQVNKLLDGAYDEFGDGIIYGDTDSTYFHTYATNTEEAREIGDEIAKGVNKSFVPFMKKQFLVDDERAGIILCGREIVADRGIFVMKKKYMLHLTDLDGYDCDKLKVMGLDTKRTTIPKPISLKLETFIERLLKGQTWDQIEGDIVAYKDELAAGNNILDIGIPSGINKLEQYTKEYKQDGKTRLPGHVAAAILYNRMREEHEDHVSPAITSGMKIRRFYLQRPYERFKAIALPTDMSTYEIPDWFWDFEIDKPLHLEKLVDGPIQNVVKAIGEEAPTHQTMKFKSLFEFD